MDHPNPMLSLAVVLVAGVASGLASRRFHLPAVTGQILIGILLGPVLKIFDSGATVPREASKHGLHAAVRVTTTCREL